MNNITFLANRLLAPGLEVDVLALYNKNRSGETVLDDGTQPFAETLRLSGMAKAVSGKFRVRNRIYSHIFDERWIAHNVADR